MRQWCWLLVTCGVLGCAEGPPPEQADGTAGENPALDLLPAPGPSRQLDQTEQRIARAAASAPHIYMAIQQDGSRPVSVVFAIDESKDGTPGDDPAIRLTPEDGDCNPQPLRSFNFPETYRKRPVFSGDQILLGVQPDQLPEFMAISVSTELVGLGLVEDREDTRAHNICTRKLWEAQLENPVQAG